MRDLTNRIAIVTGAGSGIGRASALALAREGAHIHVVDIDQDRIDETCTAVRALGARAQGHLADCRSEQAIAEVVESVIAADGQVDILHNNAGVGVGRPIDQMSLDDWRWTLDLNLWGVVAGIHHVVPHMLERGEGVIINTASVAGLIGVPNMSAYCATKFAVVGLSESLDAELSPRGVRVIALCPGLVRTNILADGRIDLGGPELDRVWNQWATDPDAVAAATLRAVRAGNSRVIVPFHAKLLYAIHRFAPPLSRIVGRRIQGMVRRPS